MTSNQNPEIFGESSEAFENDIAPKSTEHLSFKIKTNFLPWHKPRKQLIRLEQWAKSIAELAETLALKEQNQPLTYLSLPGPDLLDIRTFLPLCEEKKFRLQFLGLNSDQGVGESSVRENAALLNQVRSMECVDNASDVVIDQLEHLAKSGSISYERVINQRKSFDVVNIDLCGSLAEGSPGQTGATLINSVFALLNHQATSRSRDWIFFLTTRSNRDMVDSGTMSILIESVNSLMESNSSWKELFVSQNIIKSSELIDGKINVDNLSPTSFSNVFSLGIGHWVLETMINSSPAWRVDMLPQHAYHVNLKDSACDMLSLGFYCKRTNTPPPIDKTGLARLAAQSSPPQSIPETRAACQVKVAKKVGGSNDIDVKLHRDDDAYRKYLDDSAALLHGARYDVDEYIKWAATHQSSISEFLKKSNLV